MIIHRNGDINMTKVKQDALKQQLEDFAQEPPVFDSAKFYHRFINDSFDVSLVYNTNIYHTDETSLHQYASSKQLNYTFCIKNTESTILQNYTLENSNKMNPTYNSNVLPVAVRYMDYKNGLYAIERPPFQIPLDFSFKKAMDRKLVPFLEGRKIWIPWSISVIDYSPSSDTRDFYQQRLYFSKKSLSSMEDEVYEAILPNIYSDGRICFGDSTYNLQQLLQRGDISRNIASVYAFMFNDYFSAWNPDLARYPVIAYNVLSSMKIFDRIKAAKIKKTPKYLDDARTWKYNQSKYWSAFLFCMSFLDYEETLEFYQKANNIIRSSFQPKTFYDVIAFSYPNLDEEDSLHLRENTVIDIKSSLLNNYNGLERILGFRHDSLFDIGIQVVVTQIPKNVHIGQEIISNQNLIAYIYYTVFKRLSVAFEAFCKKKKLESSRFQTWQGLENRIPYMMDFILNWDTYVSMIEFEDTLFVNSYNQESEEINFSSDSTIPPSQYYPMVFREFCEYWGSFEDKQKPIKVKYEDVISNKIFISDKDEK